MLDKTRGRALALQYLSQWELDPDSAENVASYLGSAREKNKNARKYARRIIGAALEDSEKLLGIVGQAAENWSLGRMSAIERCILLLGAAELYTKVAPVKVVINEAIILAKKFGSRPESPSFVNGVLDRVAKMMDETTRE